MPNDETKEVEDRMRCSWFWLVRLLVDVCCQSKPTNIHSKNETEYSSDKKFDSKRNATNYE